MLEAVEEVKISPPVQLKRVRPEDVRARRGVVSVDLAYRLGVLLDPVTAPVDAAAENLRAHTAIEQDRLAARQLVPYSLVAHELFRVQIGKRPEGLPIIRDPVRRCAWRRSKTLGWFSSPMPDIILLIAVF